MLKSRNPPTTTKALDALIKCELPFEEGRLRDLVLAHMVHRCTRKCRQHDAEACCKGCPWPFDDNTNFNERGYPFHRRRPCDGVCPNCTSGSAAYGGRPNCVNQLIVEYCPEILLLWEGHANKKCAANMNLFEYLCKYLFKGPDHTRYDITLDEQMEDETYEWL